MRSNSPVSSQASTFLRQPSIRTRKSNIIGENNFNMTASGQGDATASNGKYSMLDESEFPSKTPVKQSKNSAITAAQLAAKRKKNNQSHERELKRKQQRTD